MPSAKLILASRSPRRRELLAEAGYRFDVCPPSDQAESDLRGNEDPVEMVTRLSLQKAADVAARFKEGVIISCDTIVECRGQILGKPLDVLHAREMLRALSGQEHRVYSGLCVWKVPDSQPQVRVAITMLRMDALSDGHLEEYLAGAQWEGKAGAFGYQDRLGWVHIVEGSESNVVGLPMELLAEMLQEIETTLSPLPTNLRSA